MHAETECEIVDDAVFAIVAHAPGFVQMTSTIHPSIHSSMDLPIDGKTAAQTPLLHS